MSDSAKRIGVQERNGVPPMWCAHAERNRAPKRSDQLLQFKGFGGGVPLNTETTAVKPRVGIAERRWCGCRESHSDMLPGGEPFCC